MRFTFRLLAALAAVACLHGSASAVPISTTNGISGNATLTTAGTSFFLNWSPPGQGALDTATTKFNGAPIPVGVIATFLANYEFDSTPIPVMGGTKYNFLNFAAAFAVQLQPTAGQGGGVVEFSLGSLVAFIPDFSEDSIVVNGTLNLLQNTSGFDFSPYTSGGIFTITFNGTAGGNLNKVIADGLSDTGTASFSTAAADPVVPEPASMIVFGVLALGGVAAVARRKLLARRGVATVA